MPPSSAGSRPRGGLRVHEHLSAENSPGDQPRKFRQLAGRALRRYGGDSGHDAHGTAPTALPIDDQFLPRGFALRPHFGVAGSLPSMSPTGTPAILKSSPPPFLHDLYQHPLFALSVFLDKRLTALGTPLSNPRYSLDVRRHCCQGPARADQGGGPLAWAKDVADGQLLHRCRRRNPITKPSSGGPETTEQARTRRRDPQVLCLAPHRSPKWR